MTQKPEPEYRQFVFMVQVINDDAELISLLSQVLECYPDANKQAAAIWFKRMTGLV